MGGFLGFKMCINGFLKIFRPVDLLYFQAYCSYKAGLKYFIAIM